MVIILREEWDDESRRLLNIYLHGAKRGRKRLATRKEIVAYLRSTIDSTDESVLEEAREHDVQFGEEEEEARMLAAEEKETRDGEGDPAPEPEVDGDL